MNKCKKNQHVRIRQQIDKGQSSQKSCRQTRKDKIYIIINFLNVEKRCEHPSHKEELRCPNSQREKRKNKFHKSRRNFPTNTVGGYCPEILYHLRRCNLHSDFSRFNSNLKIMVRTGSQFWKIKSSIIASNGNLPVEGQVQAG